MVACEGDVRGQDRPKSLKMTIKVLSLYEDILKTELPVFFWSLSSASQWSPLRSGCFNSAEKSPRWPMDGLLDELQRTCRKQISAIQHAAGHFRKQKSKAIDTCSSLAAAVAPRFTPITVAKYRSDSHDPSAIRSDATWPTGIGNRSLTSFKLNLNP